MSKENLTTRPAFTLVELLIAMVLAIIVLAAIGITITDGVRGWNIMYSRIHSPVRSEGQIAGKAFEAVVRKSSWHRVTLDEAGSWVELYYPGPASVVNNRYARFYTTGSELKLEYGALDPKVKLGTQQLCSDVSSCVFRQEGRSVQMILTLDDGSETWTAVSSAVMHNRR
jgi:hypothetical protein